MNREFLQGFSLTDDVIDKIMAENGKDIEREKTAVKGLENENTTLKTQIKERDSDLVKLKEAAGQHEGIIKEFEALKTKYSEDAEKIKTLAKEKADLEFSHLLKEKLSGTGAKDIDVLKALIKVDGLKVVDNDIKGLSEQIEKIKTEKGFLFETEEKQPQFSAGTKGAKCAAPV